MAAATAALPSFAARIAAAKAKVRATSQKEKSPHPRRTRITPGTAPHALASWCLQAAAAANGDVGAAADFTVRIQANIVGPLVNLLQEAEPGAKEAAAAALGNLASCADGELRATVTAELCDGAGVARLVGLLREGNGLEEEAARALLHVVSHDADAGHVAAVAQAVVVASTMTRPRWF